MSAPYYSDDSVTLWHGDALAVLRDLPDGSVDCCVTSPPYFGLRDYGSEGQYGLEASPADYVENMRAVFAEVRRVLAEDGTLWLNIGDSYSAGMAPTASTAGSSDSSTLTTASRSGAWAPGSTVSTHTKPGSGVPAKNLMGIPWRTAFALQDDGWILRNDIIWAKPNGMPESIRDRLSTKHEHLFMFSKRPRYWFDLDPIREPFESKPQRRLTQRVDNVGRLGAGNSWSRMLSDEPHVIGHEHGRNPGDVWSIPTSPFSEAHFAVMPIALAERAIQAGCKPGGTVLDPFSGSGTTGLAAARRGRKYVGIDLSSDYLDLSLRTRLMQTALFDGEASA